MGKSWTGNNRAPWHDYTKRQIYHITLKKRPEIMPFGSLAGDWHLPKGAQGRSYIKASPLGSIIKDCLKDIRTIHPALRIYQYALMPDHLHILLSVEYPLDEILGRKLAAFKVMVNQRTQLERVFEKGFNDQILTTARSLDTIYEYLRANPYRLAVRRACPQYFRRVNRIEIKDKVYSAYGNFQLLHHPFKEQVVIHRADTLKEQERNRERWLHVGGNGGVVVSPFISQAEKKVRTEAEALGARVILIVHEAFPELYKPAAHDFNLCAEGKLLIISMGYASGTPLSRQMCLEMNDLAQTLSAI